MFSATLPKSREGRLAPSKMDEAGRKSADANSNRMIEAALTGSILVEQLGRKLFPAAAEGA